MLGSELARVRPRTRSAPSTWTPRQVLRNAYGDGIDGLRLYFYEGLLLAFVAAGTRSSLGKLWSGVLQGSAPLDRVKERLRTCNRISSNYQNST